MTKFILPIILLITQICAAQPNYRDGYVITNTGDTLSGLVNFREGTRNYLNLQFKRSENEVSKIYSPNEIIGFGFSDGRFFESICFDRPAVDTPRVFLEVLVKGVVSLYTSEGSFFIQKGDSAIYELTISKKEVIRNGATQVVVTKKYLEILSLLLSDSEEAKSLIPATLLNNKSLIKIVECYNSDTSSPYVRYESNKPAIKFTAGVSSGLIMSHLNVNEGADSKVSEVNSAYENSNSFTTGISFYLAFPRSRERMTLQIEMYYSDSEYSNPYTDKVSLTQLTFPVGLRYTFPVRRFSPYLNLGFLFTINTNTSGNLWLYQKVTGVGYDKDPVELNDNQYGLWLGSGLSLPLTKRIAAFVDLRSELLFEVTDLSYLAKINNIRMCFGVRIQ